MTRAQCHALHGAIALVVVVACGSPAASPDASTTDAQTDTALDAETGSPVDDGSSNDATSQDAPIDALDASGDGDALGDGGCNGLVAPPAISAAHSSAVPPTPTGGAVATGSYAMTAMTVYDGQTGPYGQWTMGAAIGASTFDTVHDFSGFLQTLHRTWSTSQKTLALVTVCPSPANEAPAYSADATSLTLFTPWFNNATLVIVLTKQ